MINGTDNLIEWAQIGVEVDEAIEPLQALSTGFEPIGSISITEFEIEMGHVYVDLNCVWTGRARTHEIVGEQ